MGLFDRFKKKEEVLPEAFDRADTDIVALADGELIDVTTVPDAVFAETMMGDSIAFRYDADKVILCSPANGTLSVLFPTGHAFGVTMNNGVELLVHCGIDIVSANGDGFRILKKKQGDKVKAGDPIVEVDIRRLCQKYDMSTIQIITNANDQTITFAEPQTVVRGQSVIK